MAKLYYNDAYLKHFTTNLREQKQDKDGRDYVVLEETAFYPGGGGQPHDIGTLNGMKVLEVEEVDKEIRHYVEAQLPDGQVQVIGEIDWERRFDFMQQHAGQHILSAAFAELFGYETVSFHLGKETLTIDLHTAGLTEEQAQAAEDFANKIILENRPIETNWVTLEESKEYPLRKQPSVQEEIRLVIISDFDYNGCGGTHPNGTGQVAAIKILDWEKQRKHIRLQFVCGKRVLKQLQQKHREVKVLSQLLNAPEEQLAASAQKLLDDKKAKEKELEETKDQLLEYEMKDLLANAIQMDHLRFASAVYENRSMQDMQKMGRRMQESGEGHVLLLINETEGKLQFVCARGNGLSISMKQLAGELLKLVNGKGGGNDLIAQGGGEPLISSEALWNAAKAQLQIIHMN